MEDWGRAQVFRCHGTVEAGWQTYASFPYEGKTRRNSKRKRAVPIGQGHGDRTAAPPAMKCQNVS